MANPTLTIAFDKPTYKPGDNGIVTLTANDPDHAVLAVTGTYQDSQGNPPVNAVGTVIIDPGLFSVASVPARTFTLLSNDGIVARYGFVA